jgi:hypothetical protein
MILRDGNHLRAKIADAERSQMKKEKWELAKK